MARLPPQRSPRRLLHPLQRVWAPPARASHRANVPHPSYCQMHRAAPLPPELFRRKVRWRASRARMDPKGPNGHSDRGGHGVWRGGAGCTRYCTGYFTSYCTRYGGPSARNCHWVGISDPLRDSVRDWDAHWILDPAQIGRRGLPSHKALRERDRRLASSLFTGYCKLTT